MGRPQVSFFPRGDPSVEEGEESILVSRLSSWTKSAQVGRCSASIIHEAKKKKKEADEFGGRD